MLIEFSDRVEIAGVFRFSHELSERIGKPWLIAECAEMNFHTICPLCIAINSQDLKIASATVANASNWSNRKALAIQTQGLTIFRMFG